MISLARLLDEAAGADRVRVVLPRADEGVSVATPLGTVSSQPVDGTYPDLDAVMPSASRTRIEVDGRTLRRAVATVAGLAPDGAPPLTLEIAAGELALRLEPSEGTVVRSVLPAAVEGEIGVWGADIASNSGGAAFVLMQQPAEPIAANNLADGRAGLTARNRCAQLRHPVRAARVVVVDVLLQHALEVALPQDQQPVEAFPADGPDPPLGVRPRPGYPKGSTHHLHPVGAEDIVE
jgi:hypothetical protein